MPYFITHVIRAEHQDLLTFTIDLKPTNILLELDNSEDAVTEYLSTTSPRLLKGSGTEQLNSHVVPSEVSAIPLREIIPTPLITLMKKIHVRIVDFGVCMLSISTSHPDCRRLTLVL